MRKSTITLALLTFVTLWCNCNRIADSISSATTITFTTIETVPQFYPPQLFSTRSTIPVQFSGTCSTATVAYDGTKATRIDSCSASITYCKDTLLNDGTHLWGTAQIRANDILSWNTVGYHCAFAETFLIGKLLKMHLSPTTFHRIDSLYNETTQFPAFYKDSIVTAFNAIINTHDFFNRYYANLDSVGVLVSLAPLVKILIAEKIFTDTTGTLSPDLSLYQQEKIKWFTIDIFINALDFAPSDTKENLFKPVPVAPRIYKHVFTLNKNSSASATTITRFFTKRFLAKENAISLDQVAYLKKNLLLIPSDTQIATYPFRTNTPFIATPLHFFEEWLEPLMVKGAAIITYRKDLDPSLDTLHFDYVVHYPLKGALDEDGERVDCLGSAMVQYSFYYPSNSSLLNLEATLTKAVQVITLQRENSKKQKSLFTEKTMMFSNYAGASGTR